VYEDSTSAPAGIAPLVEAPAAVLLRRLLDDGATHLQGARTADREASRHAANRARELAAFARCRPAALFDRPDDEVGAAAAASRAARPQALTAVSEWAVDEVAASMRLSGAAACQLLTESVTLVEALPATLNALEAGAIGWSHARMLTEVLAPLQPADRAEVEARLLTVAPDRRLTQLRAAARRAVLGADATAAARRLAAAIRERQVRMFPGEDGMASLGATMTLPVALACYRALEVYAADCATPGDERTKDQRMTDCLTDLILRPGTNPPVQVQLTVVAGASTLTGGNEDPGEIDGHPVPAALVRELAHTLGLLPRPGTPADIPAAQPPAEPVSTDVPAPAAEPPTPAATPTGDAPTTDALTEQAATGEPAHPATDEANRIIGANERAAANLAALLGLHTVAGTALAHLPAIAVIDEISGQLLALTNAGELCRKVSAGDGLGPPPATAGYSPSAPLDRFVRARDRRCRFPGCRARAQRCDLDHNQPWPAGTTSEDNLCCLCRHHHRLSHQAPGWQMHRLPDGGLQWTTPGGEQLTTSPPRYGTDDNLPPPTPTPTPTPTPPPPPPPLTDTERVLGRPQPPDTPDHDPAPF
jgi:hypothetical protein